MAIPFDGDPKKMSLAEARKWLRTRAATLKQYECPCCKQDVQVFKRKLNANMARFLISLTYEHLVRGDWVHYKKCSYRGRDYPYLPAWGLAETAANEDSKKRSSGLWRPTEKGIDFVYGRIKVPTHAYIFDNQYLKHTRELIDIRGVLKEPFDFAELMRAGYPPDQGGTSS
jgi:hypothetical protein